jgi:hypothetical protein
MLSHLPSVFSQDYHDLYHGDPQHSERWHSKNCHPERELWICGRTAKNAIQEADCDAFVSVMHTSVMRL